MRIKKWLYPGLKIKRWLFLLVASALIGIIGLSKVLSDLFRGWSIKLIPDEFIYKIRDHLIGLKFIDFVAIAIGIIGIATAFKMVVKTFTIAFIPEKSEDFANINYKYMLLKKGPKIVAMGGGTGLPSVLYGIKEYTSNITAIVTVADDGGSSGKIRQIFKIPPPGDIRNCIVALADRSTIMGDLFQYRFNEKDLDGHNFGNLFITAMSNLTGDFDTAIKESSKVLAIRGQVVPVTLDRVSIGAKLKDDTIIDGESKITRSKSPIDYVFLKPKDVTPTKEAIISIKNADAIILGPGSLYTSIIPNLLVKQITEEINNSTAVKIYVCNIMTQYSETAGYTASDHINTLFKYGGENIIDYVLVNTEEIPNKLAEKYKGEYSEPVTLDEDIVNKKYTLIKAKLLDISEGFVRHDSVKLARSIIKLISV